MLMLCVIMLNENAECHFAECSYADWHYAESSYAECHYVESSYAECHYHECSYAECHTAESRSANLLWFCIPQLLFFHTFWYLKNILYWLI